MIASDFGKIFQLSYVTRNLTGAIARFGEVLGVKEFLTIDVGAAAGRDRPHGAHVGLAWAGDTSIELIEPVGTPSPIFVDDLATLGEDEIRLNHIGVLVPDEDHWSKLCETVERHKLPIVSRGHDPDNFQIIFVDLRAVLGHYVEFVLNTPALEQNFATLPRN